MIIAQQRDLQAGSYQGLRDVVMQHRCGLDPRLLLGAHVRARDSADACEVDVALRSRHGSPCNEREARPLRPEALDLVRTLSRTLAPPVALRDMPLDAAMRWFIRDTHERRGRELILSTPELGASTAGSSGSIDPVARFALFEALDTIIERAPIQTMPTLRISMTSDVGQLAIAIDVPDAIDLSELTERAGWCGVRIELVPGSPMRCVLTVRRFADPRRTPEPLSEGQQEAALTTSSSPI